MTADPRAALATLVAAFERHLDASATRRGENDPAVVAAYQHLADAFDVYDDALMDAYGEVTPLDIYNGPFEDDEDEDTDEDEDEDDVADLEDELDDEDDDDEDDAEEDDAGEDDSEDDSDPAGAATDVLDDHDDEDGDTGVYLGLDDSEYDVSRAGEELERVTPPRRP